MCKTLDRYLLKELIPPFFLGLLICTLILFMDKVMRIVEMIVTKGVPLVDVLKLLGCLVPNFLLLTLPIAFLLAVMLSFNRISADNEYTAWKVAGVSLYRFLPPVYGAAFVVCGLAMCLSLWIAPYSLRMFNTTLHGIATSHALVGLKERVFFDEFPGIVVYVEKGVPGNNKLEGIFIADLNLSEDPVLYFAKEGAFHTDEDSETITAVLRDGCIHRRLSKKDAYQVLYFTTYTVHLKLDQHLFPQDTRTRRNEELTLGELRQHIREKAAGKALRATGSTSIHGLHFHSPVLSSARSEFHSR